MHFHHSASLLALCIFSAAGIVHGQWTGPWSNDDPGDHGGSPWWNPDGTDDGPNSSTSGDGGGIPSASTLRSINRATVAHGILATLVWVFFIPIGALLLRIGINSPIIIRLHATIQLVAYLGYILAVGLGIWLVRQLSSFEKIWNDPHPIIGIVILVIAIGQPLAGVLHHRKYKKDKNNFRRGVSPPPARTAIGQWHVWIGRSLILLAAVNGGLGLRLAAKNSSQPSETTKKLMIIYAVLTAWMLLLYFGITANFEWKRAAEKPKSSRPSSVAMKDVPPPYEELQHRATW